MLKYLGGRAMLAFSLLAASLTMAQADNATIRIGVITDMGGTYSALAGPGSVYAVQRAVEEMAGEAKGKKVEVIFADHQNKVDVAAGIARKWYSADGVDAIVGTTGSGIALALTELAKQYNKALFVTSSLSTQISNEGCSLNSLHYGIDTYALSNGTVQALAAEGKKSWFLVAVDYAFGKSLASDAEQFIKAGGGQVRGVAWHPLNNFDFAAQLLQAQSSKAEVVAFANAGNDLVNAIKQAREFGVSTGSQVVTSLALWITDVHAMGIDNAQGMVLTQAFDWNMNDQTREFSAPFFQKFRQPPTSYHAAEYSVTRHFLKSVGAGVDWTDGRMVIAKMKGMKVNDFFARDASIREDGTLLHDLYLFKVKKPSEVKSPWDYFTLVRTIPGEQAFQPLSQSRCSLVKK